MQRKSIGFIIFMWAVVIISARALLFTTPVLISKISSQDLNMNSSGDWFMLNLTIVALIYFMAGVATVMKIKAWRIIHYFSAGLTLLLFGGMLSLMNRLQEPVVIFYFIPVVFALAALLAVVTLGGQVQQASEN